MPDKQKARPWTPRETAWIKANYPKMTRKEVHAAFAKAFPNLPRTLMAIVSHASGVGALSRGFRDRWSKEELTWLKENFSSHIMAGLQEKFRRQFGYARSLRAMQSQARAQRLTVAPATMRAAYLSRPASQRRIAWEAIPRYTAFERLSGDFVVCSDIHVPKVDPEMLAYVVEAGKRFRVSNLLILGDFFDQDEFSHWAVAGLQPRDVEFKDELIYACQVLEEALNNFKKVCVLRGNHDERILRLLRYALDLRSVFGLVGQRSAKALKAMLEDRLLVSDYTFCHVNSTWFCCHPSTYSKVPGAAAREIAETEGMSVIMGNGHLLSMTRDKSDRYWACESGCLVDPLKVYYKQMQVKRFPKWQRGFIVLRKNQPLLLHREHLQAGVL